MSRYSPMTKPSLLLAGLGIACSISIAFADPAVFHHSESASAKDVVGFQGAGFSVVPEVYIGTVNVAGGTSAYTLLPTITAQDNYVSAAIPTGYAFGLYEVIVKDVSGAMSTPVYLNKARVTSVEFPEIDPNREFRLFGRNLVVPGGTPSVRFVDTLTMANTPGIVISGGDSYIVKIKAPATLVPGRAYTIYYKNGFGGITGESSAPVTVLARAGGTDSLGLGVPWGLDFSAIATNVYDVKTDSRLTIHAVGDGVANDTAAIQGAIDAASTAGGGVVHVPAGTYRIATYGGKGGGVALTLKSNVVLRGAGQGVTTLDLRPPSAVTTHSGQIWVPLASSVMGIMNMTVQSSTQITGTTKIYPVITVNDDTRKFFCVDVTVDGMSWALGGVRLKTLSGGDLLMRGCTVKNLRQDGYAVYTKDYTGAPNAGRYVYIKNNSFPTLVSGIHMGGQNVIFEGNSVNYDGTYFNSLITLGQTFGASTRDRVNVSGPDCVVLNNTFTHSGNAWTYGNDSENILGEDTSVGASGSVLGSVSAGAVSALSDSSRAWAPNAFVGKDVVLLAGPGAGQVRKITGNTATELTVTPTWTVLPTADSKYCVTNLNVPRLLVKGNTMLNKQRIILLYMGAYDVAVVNNTGTNSEHIWMRGVSSIADGFANPMMKVLVADNTLTATSTAKASTIFFSAAYYQSTRWGTLGFLNEVRRNTVTSKGSEIFRASTTTSDQRYPHQAGNSTPQGQIGMIFDGNTANDGINAYGWTPGIDGLNINRPTTNDAFRDTYSVVQADGNVVPGASLATGALLGDGTGTVDLEVLEIPTNVTVEGMLKSTFGGAILSNRNPGTFVMTLNGAGKIAVWDNQYASGGTDQAPTVINDNQWHHFAWTCDGATSQFFMDGSLVKTSSRTRAGSTGIARIAGDQPNGGNAKFNGQLNEMRIWSGVRSSSDINTYRSTKLAGDEPGLLQYWRLDEGSGSIAHNHVLSQAMRQGVMGYWRLDEGSGSTLSDSSGYGNHGTRVHTPDWTTGYIGHALLFTGGTSYARASDSPSLSQPGSFTIHARVRINSISSSWANNWRGVVCKGDPNLTSRLGWELGTYSQSGAAGPTPPVGFFIRRGSGASIVTVYSPPGISTGQFYTVDAVWDSAAGKTFLYVDGVLQGTSSVSISNAPSTSDLLIGKRAAGGHLDGVVDDVKIFNRALSPREIIQLL